MKNASLITAILLLSGNALAATGTDQLVSLETLRVGDGLEVSLPTVRTVDGTICQSYVSEVSRVSESRMISVKVSKVCGPERRVSNERGGSYLRPANLRAIRTFTSDGLTIQFPDVETSG